MDWLEISIIAARTLIEIIFFAIGASIFSFLNVIIYRLPRKKQFTKGKSMCTSCGHELVMKDMIPIFSWVSLRGKCRYCGAPVSARYTLVELLGGFFSVMWTMYYGVKPMAAVAFLISCVVTVVVFIMFDKILKKHEDEKY
ncbi:MAG: prepilin peptidase [Eubacterium sp.]|nr:prepilin peptidase [Eubacterium sp.]